MWRSGRQTNAIFGVGSLFYYLEQHAQYVFLGLMPARRMFIDSPAWTCAHVWIMKARLLEFSIWKFNRVSLPLVFAVPKFCKQNHGGCHLHGLIFSNENLTTNNNKSGVANQKECNIICEKGLRTISTRSFLKSNKNFRVWAKSTHPSAMSKSGFVETSAASEQGVMQCRKITNFNRYFW